MNGDPSDPSDQGGVTPRITHAGGLRFFHHLVRKGDPDLVYTVLTSPDLSRGSWTAAMPDGSAILPYNDDYDEIVHPVPDEAESFFLRLKIEHP